MNCEEAYAYLTTLPHAEATFPFDDVSLVMKVGGKMFALLPLDAPDGITLKCDPERAIELRERYASVKPAWHFNKKHWNTVFFAPRCLPTSRYANSSTTLTGWWWQNCPKPCAAGLTI